MQNGLLRVEQQKRERARERTNERERESEQELHSPFSIAKQNKQIMLRLKGEEKRQEGRRAGVWQAGRVASARHALTSANFRVLSHVSLN